MNTAQNFIQVNPISHASMVLKWGDKVIYTDPVGSAEIFAGQPIADLVLLTDIHGDHLDPTALQSIVKDTTTTVMPQAVADELKIKLPGALIILKNAETKVVQSFSIEAIPMYNIPESATAFHVKGRGNGYVLKKEDKRVYISGDTAGIPEMKNLKNIDMAFICMNLPYTMSVEEAAQAVLAFKPKVATPYHYRGPDGLSDINKFKTLVNSGDPNIQIELLNFYPEL